MIVALSDWQNKSRALYQALTAAGHHVVDRHEPADVLLIDTDYGVGHYRPTLRLHRDYGSRIFLYTHGKDAFLGWDGIWEPWEVDGYLTFAPGIKHVMTSYATPYPNPVHVIGWWYCEQKPFIGGLNPRRVLFAPWHPHQGGYLPSELKALNARILDELLDTFPAEAVTVRYIHHLENNGLTELHGVTYTQGHADNSVADIDAADLVVGCGTFSLLSIARGKPTIMFGQDIQPHESYHDGHYQPVASWERYRHMMHYPFEWDEKPSIEAVMCVEPVFWKQQFIGPAFDAAGFIKILEKSNG